ncbi:MAG: flagellin hook IN motif-containing protein [Pirellulaceae bacterium]
MTAGEKLSDVVDRINAVVSDIGVVASSKSNKLTLTSTDVGGDQFVSFDVETGLIGGPHDGRCQPRRTEPMSRR